ncbi:hypothetical protein HYU06_05825 [Candidatus Woesearchaeota archaeon]|nr:hypothetical protein [Candidatus Woesearchaeota archaeon]
MTNLQATELARKLGVKVIYEDEIDPAEQLRKVIAMYEYEFKCEVTGNYPMQKFLTNLKYLMEVKEKEKEDYEKANRGLR